MHYVTCIYCKEKFDRDKIEFTKIKERQYAHKECAEKYLIKKTQDEKDLEELEKYIMKLFGQNYINAKVRKQIRDYRQLYKYSYSGMLKTLFYWYEIKGHKFKNEEANYGIGIIPYIYEKAHDYYYSLFLAQTANEGKNIEDYKPKIKIIQIISPSSERKKIKLFDLDKE